MNIGKIKTIVFEKLKYAVCFSKQYGVRKECTKRCKIWLEEERMEEVSEFRYI